MIPQENGGSSVLTEQRRGAKSKHERKKGSNNAEPKDNGSKSFLDKTSPVSRKSSETTKANDADSIATLSETKFQVLLDEIVDNEKKPSEKSPLYNELLDQVNTRDNNDNRINNNNSSGTVNHNSAYSGNNNQLLREEIKSLSLNSFINNTASQTHVIAGSNGGNVATTAALPTSSSLTNTSTSTSTSTGCEDFMRAMGSVTGRTMGASESRSDHRSPDDDDNSSSQTAPVILTGRLEDVRNSSNPGENSKRKKKDLSVKKTYKSDSVLGHMGNQPIETLMEMFDEPQSNHKDHGKGHKVKNNVKAKESATVTSSSNAYSPSSTGESTPSPPVASPERSQRPLSPQSERGGSPLGLAERCEVPWLSDPDRAEPADWEKVTRRTRRQKKTPSAPFVAPDKRDREHRERHPPFHHNPHHHNNNNGSNSSSNNNNNINNNSNNNHHQQQQTLPTQAAQQQLSPATKDSLPTTALNATLASNSMAKKASPPLSRIASNADDDFPPIGPPPSHGTRSDLKPKAVVTTGPWGSGRMADVLQGKKVPPPPPSQQQPQQTNVKPAAKQPVAPASNNSGNNSNNNSNNSNNNSSKARMRDMVPDTAGPILPPAAGEYGEDFREDECLSFGNFDVETIRSIKASARIRVASRRDEEELKSCFNYRQCVKLLNDHWLEVHKPTQDHPIYPSRSIAAGGIRRQ